MHIIKSIKAYLLNMLIFLWSYQFITDAYQLHFYHLMKLSYESKSAKQHTTN